MSPLKKAEKVENVRKYKVKDRKTTVFVEYCRIKSLKRPHNSRLNANKRQVLAE